MKRTSAVISFSAMIFMASIIGVGNAVAFANGGTIDTYFSKGNNYGDSEKAEQALTEGKELAQEICQNGFVLLKNESLLPFDTTFSYKVNIFGWGGSDNGFLYQGGGSSEGGYSGDKISLYDAFRQNGFEINEELASAYNNLTYRREGAPDQNQHSVYYRTYEGDQEFYDANLAQAKEFSDTAIVVLSRRATEGDDLPKVSYDEHGNADESRNYLALTQKEELMMDVVTENFENVIVLFNSSAPMEMGFIENPKVDAAMYIGYPGYYGTQAVPSILKGETNPSGHLTDTVAYSLASAPSYVNSGSDASMVYGGKGGRYKDYAEDIYVGYKWYETADEEGYFDNEKRTDYDQNLTGYEAVVQFPFGYGLSYTDFSYTLETITNQDGEEVSIGSTINKDDTLTFKIWVENIGEVPGKEVVQLYYNAPYTKGGIEKASQNLVGFEKTALLNPGIGQFVEISVKASDMTSYDTYDRNNNGFMGYELEEGEYHLSFRSDSHTVQKGQITPGNKNQDLSFTFNVPKGGYKYETDPVTDNEVKNRFTTYTNEVSGATSTVYEPQSLYQMSIDGNDSNPAYNQGITYLSRSDFKGTYPKRTETRSMSDEMYNNVFLVHDPLNNPEDIMPKVNSKETSWTLKDVQGLPYDDPKWNELISQLSIREIQNLCAHGGFGTNSIPSIGKGACVDSDGGTGFTSGVATGDGGHATKYPGANILASTWDWKEAYKWGHAIGEEGKALGINGWYAPGCNVHRSPLGGRNFEYFSEDGFMCGKFVAQTVKGCTENGVYAYMKHFAANDTDEGRNGQFIWMTEQSLREIWAKPGEVATKEGKANAMMVSVDRIGATRGTGSYALLTSLLRDEWGFRGCTITDYYQAGNVNDLDEGIRVGNDLALNPAGDYKTFDDWANPSATSVIALQNAAHNILYTYIDTIDRTAKFTGIDLGDEIGSRTEDTSGRWWRPTLYAIDAVIGVGFLSWAIAVTYFTWFSKRKAK